MPEMDGYYVEPSSTIYLYAGVPLDSNYEHTLWWDSVEAQNDYFDNQVTYRISFEQQYYTRPSRGTIRLNITSDSIVICNYMMFINEAFSSRRYYAFIDYIEYSANNVATIYYTIDHLQTWFFDMELLPCFIERQHSETDEYFENLVTEDFDLGPDYVVQGAASYYLSSSSSSSSAESSMRMGLLIPGNLQHSGSGMTWKQDTSINGVSFIADKTIMIPIVFVDDECYADDGTAYQEVDNIIFTDLIGITTSGLGDSILGYYAYPEVLDDSIAPLTPFTEAPWYNDGDTADTNGTLKYRHLLSMTMPTSLDGYVPRNKKMFNNPFSYLLITNNSDHSVALYWELFDWDESDGSTICHFAITGTCKPSPCAELGPCKYRNKTYDSENALQYKDFPQLPWPTNSWLTYWAQNRNSVSFNVAMGAAQAGAIGIGAQSLNNYAGSMASAMTAMSNGTMLLTTGNPALTLAVGMGSAVMSAAKGIGSIMAKYKDLEQTPSETINFSDKDVLNLDVNRCKFNLYKMSIHADVAERIDSYMSRYGYAQHITARPNLHARKNWTYVQTVGCMVNGTLPTYARTAIEEIFNKGITFWVEPEHLGDYEYYSFDDPCLE